jgi:hypothetical protein
MPDAARLVAALSLALIAFVVSGLIMPLMPEGTNFGWFTYVNIVLGVLCGWIVMGKRAGRGITPAINNGLTGVAALVFWGLFVQGGYEMVRLAMRNRFDGPLDAFSVIFEIGLDYGITIFEPTVVLTLLAGAVLAGLATEFAWRSWR